MIVLCRHTLYPRDVNFYVKLILSVILMLNTQIDSETLCKFLDRGLCLKRGGGGSVADRLNPWTNSRRFDTAQIEKTSQ